MKFQLKALVAALALAAVAVPAQAAIDLSATGNGSLILTVFDKVANISATFDLGKNYSDFSTVGTSFANSGVTTSGTSFSWNLSTGDYSQAFSQFLASANLANVQYAIGAGDNLGAGAGGRGFITTYASAGSNITSQQVLALASNFDTYTSENTSSAALYQNHTTVDNGSSVANSGASFAGQYYANSKNFGVGANSTGAIGSDLGVAQYTSAATTFATGPLTVFGNGAKFNLASNGSLVYSTNSVVTPPVPEADTWAMMLLGLGFMGFVARRRKQA